MSTPARRPASRRSNDLARLKLAGLAFAASAILIYLKPGTGIWALITTAAVAAAYILGRLHGAKPAPRRARSEFGRARSRPQVKADGRARSNGWIPPASPKLTSLALSPECAGGECHLCNGCEHGCGHDPATITARNEAAYDAAHADDPPF